MTLPERLTDRLASLRAQIAEDPLANPIRQLAHDLSRELESGELSLSTLQALVDDLCDEGFSHRATHLADYLKPVDGQSPETALAGWVAAQTESAPDFDALQALWTRTRDVIVFTGHPTFILSPQRYAHLAKTVADKWVGKDVGPATTAHMAGDAITLTSEHAAVMKAIDGATQAIGQLHRAIFDAARQHYPTKWRTLRPAPMRLASWVGYDMDGRNDIGWDAVIRHRLSEKVARLMSYRDTLGRISQIAREENEDSRLTAGLDAMRDEFGAAMERNRQALDLLSATPLDAAAISAFANHLTQNGPGRLTSLTKPRGTLDELLDLCTDSLALEIKCLQGQMDTFGLGVGDIHFRLNAAQIRNAARHALKLGPRDDLFGRTALEQVQTLIENTSARQVNFASLAIEEASASRLFIAMAQILKHIDGDSPIRLLIAECENPVTVLVAVYLAKLFGVENKVDVCPLFETGHALDRSRRILEVLLQQPAFRTYAMQRGRVAIQAGFSDAGRFMGQVPATLAIERLQGHFAQLIDASGLGDLEAVVFDTHGDSMGRGNHQGSILDRALYALSPWARAQFADRGIGLSHETSFQGGDGYVYFAEPALAVATITGILRAHDVARDVAAKPDPFYENISISLDFYRKVKKRQEDLFDSRAYQVTLSAFGTELLPPTGSRKVKRQFERPSEEDASLRKIRAIPHNAILQQMALLANITGGIGEALASEPDYFVSLARESDRFNRLMRLVHRARSKSEMKVFIAYMKLFDGSFWATRPLSGKEPQLERPCADLAEKLSTDARYFSALQLAATLRSDSISLAHGLDAMDLAVAPTPQAVDMLHAIRIALIQHLFILAARLPEFAPGNGYTRTDIMRLIFALRVPEACDLLREIFPTEAPSLDDFQMDEAADWPDRNFHRYKTLQDDIVTPMAETHRLILQVSVGISYFYSAIG